MEAQTKTGKRVEAESERLAEARERKVPWKNGDCAKKTWERGKRCRKQLGNLSVKPCR